MSVAITLKSGFAAGVKKRILLVKEEGRNVGAVQDVLEIVREGLVLVEGLLQLTVKRRKFLVE